MSASIAKAESVLAIDIGSVHTRALLFDVVDGTYHFIAGGTAPSTANAPYCDVGEGIHQAVKNLQDITGLVLIDAGARLILPEQPEGGGVDRLVMTISAGPEVRLVTLGLLSDVSLGSAQHLASSVCGKIVESIGLNDRRKTDVQIDAIIQVKPDLILLAGGTDQGASRSVYKLAETGAVGLPDAAGSKTPANCLFGQPGAG